jgi:RNA polymerase sigma factor (sigma-70 family)
MEQKEFEHIFQDTFHQYSDAIFRFCIVKVSNVPLAEDMTQEVFMRYWQYVKEGNTISNPRSLLYTIANNLAKDWYKRKKSVPLEEQDGHEHLLRSHENSPETAAMYLELLETIIDLDEMDRELILLRHVEGLDPKDIAQLYHESPNVISVRLNRAMVRLKQKLHI